MKIELSGLDRLNIINSFIPLIKKGDYLTFQAKQELLDMMSIKTEEFDDYGLKETKEGKVKWDDKINTEKEYKLNKYHVSVLKKAFDILNQQENIDDMSFVTCKKVAEMKDELQSTSSDSQDDPGIDKA